MKKLVDLRTQANLSQRQLADLAHVPQSVISKAETGQTEPSARNLCKLALALNVSPLWLMDLSTERDLGTQTQA